MTVFTEASRQSYSKLCTRALLVTCVNVWQRLPFLTTTERDWRGRDLPYTTKI